MLHQPSNRHHDENHHADRSQELFAVVFFVAGNGNRDADHDNRNEHDHVEMANHGELTPDTGSSWRI